ncbi:hypothetical protein [Flavobacterium anhuiense]|nr:hypothetical protein [Flavobacterium anhuiense]URM37164.1 hypothetical protein LLY39_00805 [Flavobacterium anhuiense]
MKKQEKINPIKVDGCAHINSVVTEKQLKERGFFIPSDIKKVHITFNKK